MACYSIRNIKKVNINLKPPTQSLDNVLICHAFLAVGHVSSSANMSNGQGQNGQCHVLPYRVTALQ